MKDGAVGLSYHTDASNYLGFYLGGSVVGYDRVALTVRLGMACGLATNLTRLPQDPAVMGSIQTLMNTVDYGFGETVMVVVVPISRT